MTVVWASKKGRALMGEVIEKMEWTYIVEVTSYENKLDRNLLGKKVVVNQALANEVK